MKKIICILMLVVVALSLSVYASNTEISLGAEVYNLVTTFCGDAGTMRGFAWSAETDYKNMAIRYSKNGEWDNAIIKNAEYTEYEDRLYYKAELTGLTAGETYLYQIGDINKNIWSSSYTFTTEAANLTEFSFIGVTDPQSGNKAGFECYADTIEKAMEDDTDASFMVNLGDMVDYGTIQNTWDYYFESMNGIIESIPHMAVMGNHETKGDAETAGKHFSLQFNNPDNGANAFGNLTEGDMSSSWGKGVLKNKLETVYSFDYGNAHFAVLNSGTDWSESDKKTIMAEQAKWLRNDLCATDKKWKIVMVHIGLYPVKTERYNTREELMDVIDECGVDLVLSGHDHMIARTYPMCQNEIMTEFNTPSVIKNGTVYNIIGAAGEKRYDEVSQVPSYLQVLEATSSAQPTYSLFDINDERIKVVSKQLDGTVLDEYRIEKLNMEDSELQIDVGVDTIVMQGVVGRKSTIAVMVSYPDVESAQSEADVCYIDQVETNNKGVYSFNFGDRQKTVGEYKITLSISGIVSEHGYEYLPKIYVLEGQKVIEKLNDISGNSLTANAEIVNMDNGRLFCAQYFKGELKDIKYVDVSRGIGDSMAITYLGSSEVDEIKLFFWDYKSNRPFVESVVIY